MAGVSKITIATEDGDRVLVDLTGDNVTADSLVTGYTAHGADGEIVKGANPYKLEPTNAEVGTQSDLIAQIQNALVGKAAGGGGGITPTGTIEITENGEHDVTAYAKANVSVSGGGEPDYRDLYQRVEYIESAVEGTYPYIITDFYADNECGVEAIASFPVLQDRVPMGSRENGDPTRFYCVYPLSANSIYYGFDTGVTISCKLTVDTIYRLQTNFLNSRLVNVYTEDGTRKGGGAISDTLTPQTAPVSIFGYNSASTGNVSSKREYKLYGARCSRGHEVVREYIPCYRKSDGVVGVVEKFTGQFLTNADPEGSAFVAGPEIDW